MQTLVENGLRPVQPGTKSADISLKRTRLFLQSASIKQFPSQFPIGVAVPRKVKCASGIVGPGVVGAAAKLGIDVGLLVIVGLLVEGASGGRLLDDLKQ
jgi:hypothetical protein